MQENCEEFMYSPTGHIRTFVSNEKPLNVYFTVLWNEALMVINWFRVLCGNYCGS